MDLAEVGIGAGFIDGGFERGPRAIEIAIESAVGTTRFPLGHSGDPLLLREAGRDRVKNVVVVRPGDALARLGLNDLRTESDPFDGDRGRPGSALVRSLRASSPIGGRAGREEHGDDRDRKFPEHIVDSSESHGRIGWSSFHAKGRGGSGEARDTVP